MNPSSFNKSHQGEFQAQYNAHPFNSPHAPKYLKEVLDQAIDFEDNETRMQRALSLQFLHNKIIEIARGFLPGNLVDRYKKMRPDGLLLLMLKLVINRQDKEIARLQEIIKNLEAPKR